MNIYCFSTLSFAKLQFKSVINKAFHKHGVASFTDAWIETKIGFAIVFQALSHLLQMRGLKLSRMLLHQWRLLVASFTDAWIETTPTSLMYANWQVASFTDAWIETVPWWHREKTLTSHLLQMRGLKHLFELGYRQNR